MRGGEELNPATVLREAWGIEATLGPQHHGISRATWRVGTIGWLAREASVRLAETQAELRLLATLATTAPFAVPVAIPTVRGPHFAQSDGYTWTLCRHIPGERLVDEPDSYQYLVTILAHVHQALRDIDPHFAILPESLLGRAAMMVHTVPRDGLPATRRAIAWLRGHIGALDALPTQIIHGDFCIPNVLVTADDPTHVGILDWELSSCDSPIFDLAQLAFGMIAFSRTQPPPDQLALLTRWYVAAGGQYFTEEQLAVALIAGRLAQIAWLRGRVAQGEEALIESVRFLDDRLAQVLRWLAYHVLEDKKINN